MYAELPEGLYMKKIHKENYTLGPVSINNMQTSHSPSKFRQIRFLSQ